MTDFFDAFEISPVPAPTPDAVAPEPFRGIYGMPMFVTIPASDLEVSTDFWVRGLGFFELFSIPGQVVHLRRWAFQDVLLVPTSSKVSTLPASGMRVNFACVLNQLDSVAAVCRDLSQHPVVGPHDTLWNTRDVQVTTPEGVCVVFTAAKPFDPASPEGKGLAAVGIIAPGHGESEQDGIHG